MLFLQRETLPRISLPVFSKEFQEMFQHNYFKEFQRRT